MFTILLFLLHDAYTSHYLVYIVEDTCTGRRVWAQKYCLVLAYRITAQNYL